MAIRNSDKPVFARRSVQEKAYVRRRIHAGVVVHWVNRKLNLLSFR